MKRHIHFIPLLLALLTLLSCAFSFVSCIDKTSDDIPEKTPEPQKSYKDFHFDEPYRISFRTEEDINGPLVVAVVEYNPYYTKPFTLVIPETNDEGAPVDVLLCDNAYAALPCYLLEEDYYELLDLMVAKHGMTFEEYNKSNILPHSMTRFRSFFEPQDPMKCRTDKAKMNMEKKYPITKTGAVVYILDSTTSPTELLWLCAFVQEQIPDWSDEWFYEKLLKMKEFCQKNSVEDPNLDKYLNLYTGFGESLTDVKYPASMTTIGAFCFSGCDALTNVTVPGTVTSVSTCAFAYCSKLEEITFAEGVTVIGDYALGGCTNLKTVNLPASLENLNSNVNWDSYEYNTLTEITPPVINYAGTKEQWKGIIENISGKYASSFSRLLNNMTVNCSDGVYNP